MLPPVSPTIYEWRRKILFGRIIIFSIKTTKRAAKCDSYANEMLISTLKDPPWYALLRGVAGSFIGRNRPKGDKKMKKVFQTDHLYSAYLQAVMRKFPIFRLTRLSPANILFSINCTFKGIIRYNIYTLYPYGCSSSKYWHHSIFMIESILHIVTNLIIMRCFFAVHRETYLFKPL